MLNFYTVDAKYIMMLKKAETEYRGFSRVPNVQYERRSKFVCGPLLWDEDFVYYAPVSSYRKEMPDNLVIYAKNGQAVGSLRFNYMFPVPLDVFSVKHIDNEPDMKYRTLLAQELRFCLKHETEIRTKAQDTYHRVTLGIDKHLRFNSCAFRILEEAAREWLAQERQRLLGIVD